MKRSILYLSAIVLILVSCKQENVSPQKTFRGTTSLSSNSGTNASVIGTWTWSAQYATYMGTTATLTAPAYLLNPTNTGITETLLMSSDSTWSQTQNGSVVNSGTFHLVDVITPDGPSVFINLVNSKAGNSSALDNFDFSKGFNCSYHVSGDSLVFYGVYTNSTYTNLASERVYVK